MPYIESLQEFRERQCCTPMLLRDRYLFPNGAQSDGGYSHIEPPSDPTALARLQHEYTTAKLAQVIKRYNQDREAIATQAQYHAMGAGPLPPDGWQEHLATLAKEIEELQATLDSLTSQLPRVQREAGYDYRRDQQRQAAKQVTAALQKLPTF